MAPRYRSTAFAKKPMEYKPDPKAVSIWETARHAAGTVVEKYLLGRGIELLPPTLRASDAGMTAAVHAPNGNLIAIQTTFLTSDGKRASCAIPRITQGSLGRGAVRLAAASEVLGLAEGVETALSAMHLFDIPVWAALGAQRMDRVAIPIEVRKLFIFADNDGPGRAAAERTAYAHRFRKVHLRYPPSVNDWNDFLISNSGDAVLDLVERDFNDEF